MPARTRTDETPADDEPKAGSQSIAAVERAIDVLLLFGLGGKGDLGVTEISGELGLSQGRRAPHPHLAAQPRPHRARPRLAPLPARPGRARPRPRLPAAHRRALDGRPRARLALVGVRGDRHAVDPHRATCGCTSTRSSPTARCAWRSRSACRTRCTRAPRRKAFLAFLAADEVDAYIERSGLLAHDRRHRDGREGAARRARRASASAATRCPSASARPAPRRPPPRCSTTRTGRRPWSRSPGPPSGSARRSTAPSRCCSRPPVGCPPAWVTSPSDPPPAGFRPRGTDRSRRGTARNVRRAPGVTRTGSATVQRARVTLVRTDGGCPPGRPKEPVRCVAPPSPSSPSPVPSSAPACSPGAVRAPARRTRPRSRPTRSRPRPPSAPPPRPRRPPARRRSASP